MFFKTEQIWILFEIYFTKSIELLYCIFIIKYRAQQHNDTFCRYAVYACDTWLTDRDH